MGLPGTRSSGRFSLRGIDPVPPQRSEASKRLAGRANGHGLICLTRPKRRCPLGIKSFRFYPLSPRIQSFKAILGELRPEQMKPYRGPPMTLGSAAAAKVRLMVWCKARGHRAEPDPAEQARWYGPETTVPEWRRRLVCSKCGSRNVDMMTSG